MSAETSPIRPDVPPAGRTHDDDPRLACAARQPLPTEASAREFVRLLRPRGLGSQAPRDLTSAVLMRFPAGTSPAEVERVARATALLARAGVPVPRTYAVAAEAGWIVQEDLGDLTLAAAVASAAGVSATVTSAAGDAPQLDVGAAYDEALALLADIAPLSLDTSPTPALGAARLRDELTLFVRTALPHLDAGRPTAGALHLPPPLAPTLASALAPTAAPPAGDTPAPPSVDRALARSLDAELDRLVGDCAARPTETCHRDYHARNLLLAGRVRIIDHQDALRGPRGYDRASLAYDPYVDLPDERRDTLAGRPDDLWPVAVQRLCKAIGTYASKGDAWREWIAPAARQARRLLLVHDVPGHGGGCKGIEAGVLADALARLAAAEPAA